MALALSALQQNINLFYTPTQIRQRRGVPQDTRIRAGGMVAKGSLTRGDSLDVQFVVTDFGELATIRYRGILRTVP